MKIKVVPILTLLAIIITACMSARANADGERAFGPTQSPEAKPTQNTNAVSIPETLGKAGIIYHRSGGIAGIDETWKFYWDGQIDTPQGEFRTIEVEKITALFQEIDQTGFYDLNDSYTSPGVCADCFTIEITVNNGQKSKMVQFMDGSADAPPLLTQLAQRLNDLITSLSPPTVIQ